VDLPSAEERAEIVEKMCRGLPLGYLPSAGCGKGRGESESVENVAGGAEGKRGEEERESVLRGVLELAKSTKCDGYSGADLASLVREAGVFALRRTLRSLDNSTSSTSTGEESDGMRGIVGKVEEGEEDGVVVCLDDFAKALEKVPPSVSAAQKRKYENLRSKFAGLPVRSVVKERGEDEKREEKLM
jgi:ribosome biogenesis ATPase